MEVVIRVVTPERQDDLFIENEPFSSKGKLIVSRIDEVWLHEIFYFDQEETTTFPTDVTPYDTVVANGFVLGAYIEEQCIGLAVFQHDCFRYMYVHDLKVSRAYRGMKIGEQLLAAAKKRVIEEGYQGIYTIGQDNNLGACLFYLHCGFVIGGLNTHGYRHTPQEEKADVYFYLDYEKEQT